MKKSRLFSRIRVLGVIVGLLHIIAAILTLYLETTFSNNPTSGPVGLSDILISIFGVIIGILLSIPYTKIKETVYFKLLFISLTILSIVESIVLVGLFLWQVALLPRTLSHFSYNPNPQYFSPGFEVTILIVSLVFSIILILNLYVIYKRRNKV